MGGSALHEQGVIKPRFKAAGGEGFEEGWGGWGVRMGGCINGLFNYSYSDWQLPSFTGPAVFIFKFANDTFIPSKLMASALNNERFWLNNGFY